MRIRVGALAAVCACALAVGAAESRADDEKKPITPAAAVEPPQAPTKMTAAPKSPYQRLENPATRRVASRAS